jgi:DinB superfamily
MPPHTEGEVLIMSSAQAGLWISDPQAYRERLFELLGDRNPLDVMAQTPLTLADIALNYPATVLRTRPFEGKWTPNEIIGHLSDGEWVSGYRLRLILCEHDPIILGMNQELWVTGQQHNDREPSELVEMFRMMRQCNLALWRRMSLADLKRTGQHSERGPEALGVMLRMTAGHDLSHLDQITRYIQSVQRPE